MHRQIGLLVELREKYNLSFEDVGVVELHLRRKGDTPCDRPDPKDAKDLQFSFHHNLGAAMLDGDVGLEHFTPEAVFDSRLKEARSKVKFIPAPDDSSEDFLDEPACVVIKTKDGRTFTGERKYAIGSFQEPLTLAQFRELYHKFTRGILFEKDISKTEELILNLEKINKVQEVTDFLKRISNAKR